MKGKPESLILFLFPLSPNSRGFCDPVQCKLVDQKCSNIVSQQTPSLLGLVEEWSLLSLQEVLGLFAFLKNGSVCGRLIVAFPKVGVGTRLCRAGQHTLVASRGSKIREWQRLTLRPPMAKLAAASAQAITAQVSLKFVSIRVWRVRFMMVLWFPAWRYSQSLWLVFISCHFPSSVIQMWTRVWHFPSGKQSPEVAFLWAEVWDAFWSAVGWPLKAGLSQGRMSRFWKNGTQVEVMRWT